MSVLLCRHCREPIHETADVCPHCGDEQPEAPGPPPEPDLELVTVFRTGDAGLIALAKSLLEGEAIEYLARGDGLQDLFGWGRLGSSFNYIVGPVEFVVRSDDAPRARALLRDLASVEDPRPSEDAQ
jgi:Putative prokaryotic signal transducing protein